MVRWSSLCGKHPLYRIRVDNLRVLHFQAVALNRANRRNGFCNIVIFSWQSFVWIKLGLARIACTQLYYIWTTACCVVRKTIPGNNVLSQAFHLFLFVIYVYLNSYTTSARYKANTTAEMEKTTLSEQPCVISTPSKLHRNLKQGYQRKERIFQSE
jgi:hypothetical protein